MIRMGIYQTIDQVVEIEDNLGKAEVDPDLRKVIGEIIIGKIQQIMEDKTAEESIEAIIIEVELYRGRNRSRERSFSRTYDSNRTSSTNNSRSRSGSRASMDRIRCYRCREYNHFTRDRSTSRDEREIELQQMLNLEENQTSLLTNIQNGAAENPRASPLHL